MGHFYFSSDFYDSAHSAEAGPKAAGVYLCSVAYCSRYRLAGRLPKDIAEPSVFCWADMPRSPKARQARAGELIDRLIRSGLWIDEGEHYRLNPLYYRLRLPDSPWSKAAYPAVYQRDGRACRYCGATAALTIDHVVPRIQGGGDEAENLVVACRTCNSRKHGRTPEQAGMVLRPVQGDA